MAHTLTWLHLSDLHARHRTDWDREEITSTLVRDLSYMQKKYDLRPNFIFFTGDVVYGNMPGDSMADQYQLARLFFDNIRKAFTPEILVRDLYIVPGNHDVDRDEITPDQTEWLRHQNRKLTEILDAMQDGKKQWRTWMERLVAYRNFLTSYGLTHLTPDDPHLVWGDSRELHGYRVGLAGMNTAWSCADNADKAKLWFGYDWQIAKAKEKMGPIDFCFSLLHHPDNWFTVHEDPHAMRRLRKEFCIVFHGHEHQDWVESDSDGRLVVSAGASYESSWMDNGYNFGSIDLDKQVGSIYLRQWDPKGRGWVAHNIAGKTDDGLLTLHNLPWVIPSASQPPSAIVESTTSHLEVAGTPESFYTRRYCKYVIDQYDVLELFGCDIPRELQRHQLSVAYVSLNLSQEATTSTVLTVPLKGEVAPAPLDMAAANNGDVDIAIDDSSVAFEAVLDRISISTKRLMINGPAGAGKTTLLKWCAIHAAQQMLLESLQISTAQSQDSAAVHSQESCWRRKIPFLIRLRDCPLGRLPAAHDFPTFLAKHLPSAPTHWMTDVLDSGSAIILLDGVDEIHLEQRKQLEVEVGELVTAYPQCIYVITSRPGAVEADWLSRLNFTEACVEPMTRRDRDEFIDKWYRSAALELKQRPRAGEDLTRTASRLKAELTEQPELGALATNPLLCAMICALYRDRQEKLPETPAELSEALCHMLLHRRERETPGLADKHFQATWRALLYPQKKGLLAELSWHMVQNGESSIDLSVAQTLIGESLASTPGRTKDEAADVTQALVERSGLLRPAADDRIDFLHNTLKEYLAARRVVEEGNWETLADHADDPAWQPVILFALALAPEPFTSGLVRKLLSAIGQSKPTEKRRILTKLERKSLAARKARQFFLIRCKATARRLAPELSEVIDSFTEFLLPPGSMNDIEALAQLGPKILSYGAGTLEEPAWWPKQNCRVIARCLRLLRLIGGPRAKTVLQGIRRLPSGSSHVNNEWFLASCELIPDEKIEWPFGNSTHLTLSSSSIEDVSRIQDFPLLTDLDISTTSVKSLRPLVSLQSLQRLNIRKSRIDDLSPLAGHASLHALNFSETGVADISPLALIPTLKTLQCSATKVANVMPLSSLRLEILDLSATQIADIAPLAEVVTLKSICLSETPISDIAPISRLTAVTSLDLSSTKVSDITPLAALDSLRSLNLAGTPLNDITALSNINELVTLDLSRTAITDIAPLSNKKSLTILALFGCPISRVEVLGGLTSLSSLTLSRTLVEDISSLVAMTALRTLHLDYTPVSSISSIEAMVSLGYLSLSGTKVKDLSPLCKLGQLYALDFSETDVADIRPIKHLRRLQWVMMNDTHVSDLTPFVGLNSLFFINMQDTDVTDISPLVKVRSLSTVILSTSNIAKDSINQFKAQRPEVTVI